MAALRQLKTILPGLPDDILEAALQEVGGDIERCVAILTDDGRPAAASTAPAAAAEDFPHPNRPLSERVARTSPPPAAASATRRPVTLTAPSRRATPTTAAARNQVVFEPLRALGDPVVIMEGWMNKRGNWRLAGWSRRYFRLTSSGLYWWHDDRTVFAPRDSVPVADFGNPKFYSEKVFHIRPAMTKQNVIEIQTPRRQLVLEVSTAIEWQHWRRDIEELLARGGAGGVSPSVVSSHSAAAAGGGGGSTDSRMSLSGRMSRLGIGAGESTPEASLVSVTFTSLIQKADREKTAESASEACLKIVEIFERGGRGGTGGEECLRWVNKTIGKFIENSEVCFGGLSALPLLAVYKDEKDKSDVDSRISTALRVGVCDTAVRAMKFHKDDERIQEQACSIIQYFSSRKNCLDSLLHSGGIAAVASASFHFPENEKIATFSRGIFGDVSTGLPRHAAAIKSIERCPSSTYAGLTRSPSGHTFKIKKEALETSLRDLHPEVSPPFLIQIKRKKIFGSSLPFFFGKKFDDLSRGLYVSYFGEDGKDDGGLSRNFFEFVFKEISGGEHSDMFALSSIDNYTYQIQPSSNPSAALLKKFNVLGMLLGKVLFDGFHIPVHFNSVLYKRLVGREIAFEDLATVDSRFYESMKWLQENDVGPLELDFSVDEISDEGGEEVAGGPAAEHDQKITKTHKFELIENGSSVRVTNENKKNYIKKMVDRKMGSGVEKQIEALLTGFRILIPLGLVSCFDEKEMELILCGLPYLDIHDWRKNTEYKAGYSDTHPTIHIFWEVVNSWGFEDQARLLQFVTGSSIVPPEGFKGLHGSTGLRKFQILQIHSAERRLPQASTCVNELWLPAYTDKTVLQEKLMLAMYGAGDSFLLK